MVIRFGLLLSLIRKMSAKRTRIPTAAHLGHDEHGLEVTLVHDADDERGEHPQRHHHALRLSLAAPPPPQHCRDQVYERAPRGLLWSGRSRNEPRTRSGNREWLRPSRMWVGEQVNSARNMAHLAPGESCSPIATRAPPLRRRDFGRHRQAPLWQKYGTSPFVFIQG